MTGIKDERIATVDLLRGFALLGILLVNMPGFYSPSIYMDSFEDTHSKIYMVIDILGQGSFYPIFATLFGFGFMKIFQTSFKNNVAFTPLFSRRLFLLLCIGCVHAFVIWYGDILILYAVCGFFLLFFQEARGRTFLYGGGALFIIPSIIMILLLIVASFSKAESNAVGVVQPLIDSSISAYRDGSIAEIFSQRFLDWYYINNIGTFPLLFLSVFPFFLIGAFLAKEKGFERIKENVLFIKYVCMICFFAFLFFKVLPYLIGFNVATDFMQDSVGGPLGAIFYITLFMLYGEKIPRFIAQLLQSAGRMALTNYIAQSVVCTLLFYNYGLGFYGNVTVMEGFLLALGFFVVQCIGSSIILKRYARGPLEHLLCSFTYRGMKNEKNAVEK